MLSFLLAYFLDLKLSAPHVDCKIHVSAEPCSSRHSCPVFGKYDQSPVSIRPGANGCSIQVCFSGSVFTRLLEDGCRNDQVLSSKSTLESKRRRFQSAVYLWNR